MALAVGKWDKYQKRFQVDFEKLEYISLFRLLRPMYFWKKAKLLEDFGRRAGQQESTMIDEYISTMAAGSLRNGTHLSFHWTLSSSSSGSHLFPRARIHVHQSDQCDFTLNCLYFV
ncbi:Hypothetical_protein [Hexamita inflata]|uniref:Hypothetical_protein n=1 Tax=Hexamita inflata TaxID=28002 RepID=A0AA86NR49_9EUKA|nr:Hypothetical protein HINF_LOCUS11498 [Hexamita inflata]